MAKLLAATLFDLQPERPPTAREVARRLKADGLEGLPGADRRADHSSYQEVTCRSALNRVQGMPFQWTLNPYRGCTHGCHYCFARRYQPQLQLDSGDDFSSVIFVKVNFPAVLRRELSRDVWKARNRETRQLVAFGTATDPYQPIEGQYRVSRLTLEALVDHHTSTGLTTKGPMVVRDKDLLAELSRRTRSTVAISVPTVDEEAWQKLEPGTAHPLQRLRAVRELADAGVDVGVLMAPIVPGISSHPAKIEKTIRAIKDHGAAYVGGFVMHLEGGTRDHFMSFLAREFPHLVERYGRLYAGKYARSSYTERVRAVIGTLQARYG
jgi:DNA repair photolyase